MSDIKALHGTFKFTVGQPAEVEEHASLELSQIPEEYRGIYRTVGQTLKAYLEAAERLARDKYQASISYIPTYLQVPGSTYVVFCTDGVVIRYEKRKERLQIGVANHTESITVIAPMMSDLLVYAQPQTDFPDGVPPNAPTLSFGAVGAGGEAGATFLEVKIAVFVSNVKVERVNAKRPVCLASVRTDFEVGFEGALMEADGTIGPRFVTRTPLKLGLGWEGIEIYSRADIENWKPEFAEAWAENDIQASILAQQNRDHFFQELDPYHAARLELGALLKEFKAILDTTIREEDLQQFLTKHPVLLAPTKLKVWPKLKFGATVSDFVVRESTGEYLLVEIERPSLKLFRQDGQQTEELTHALNQVSDWRRYIEDNLDTVKRELKLDGITSNPKVLVVIGRDSTLTADNKRKLAVLRSLMPRVEIRTYDDVYMQAKTVIENLLGPLLEQSAPTKVYFPRQTSFVG